MMLRDRQLAVEIETRWRWRRGGVLVDAPGCPYISDPILVLNELFLSAAEVWLTGLTHFEWTFCPVYRIYVHHDFVLTFFL